MVKPLYLILNNIFGRFGKCSVKCLSEDVLRAAAGGGGGEVR